MASSKGWLLKSAEEKSRRSKSPSPHMDSMPRSSETEFMSSREGGGGIMHESDGGASDVSMGSDSFLILSGMAAMNCSARLSTRSSSVSSGYKRYYNNVQYVLTSEIFIFTLILILVLTSTSSFKSLLTGSASTALSLAAGITSSSSDKASTSMKGESTLASSPSCPSPAASHDFDMDLKIEFL